MSEFAFHAAVKHCDFASLCICVKKKHYLTSYKAGKRKLTKCFSQQDRMIDMSKAFWLILKRFRFRCGFRLPKHFQLHNIILEIISGYKEQWKLSCRIQSFALGLVLIMTHLSTGKNRSCLPNHSWQIKGCMPIQAQEVNSELYLEFFRMFKVAWI